MGLFYVFAKLEQSGGIKRLVLIQLSTGIGII
jgi:hypothetical protein